MIAFDDHGSPVATEGFDYDLAGDEQGSHAALHPTGEQVLEFLADSVLGGHKDSMLTRIAAILVLAGKCSRQEAAAIAGVSRRQINRAVKSAMSRIYGDG